MRNKKVMSQCISEDYCKGWNDAVSIVYARWNHIKNWSKYVCSQCSFESDNISNFCPHCGAKMDLEDDKNG